MASIGSSSVRRCGACGIRLARDNAGPLCSSCRRSAGAAPNTPQAAAPARAGRSPREPRDDVATLYLAALRKTLGDHLSSLRICAGLSQADLAARICYSRTTIACAETGRTAPARPFWDSCDDVLGAGGALRRAYDDVTQQRTRQARDRARQAELERERHLTTLRARSATSAEQGAPPGAVADEDDELRARVAAAHRVDHDLIAVLQEKVDLARVIDRRLGAPGSAAELGVQIRSMEDLLRYELNTETRRLLAAVIVDACALAGWQCLDRADLTGSWDHYVRAATAARDSESVALQSFAAAEHAVLLLDMGEPSTAAEMTAHARTAARAKVPRLLECWLAAAHGETCAATGKRAESLTAFDDADRLISGAPTGDTPYIVFDPVQLARWRGSALARLRDREAVDVLTGTLRKLDPTFTRAETALRADLVHVLCATGQRDAAAVHAQRALHLAEQIGSVRQRRRIQRATRQPPD